jgi:cytochrome bd-type quinol oxidase subunit 2
MAARMGSLSHDAARVSALLTGGVSIAHIALRLGGIALIAGAGLLGAAIVLVSFTPVVNQPFPHPVSLLILLAAILLLLSLPAMRARQAQAAGWVGLIGHVLLQTGVLLLVLVAALPLLYPTRSLIVSDRRSPAQAAGFAPWR